MASSSGGQSGGGQTDSSEAGSGQADAGQPSLFRYSLSLRPFQPISQQTSFSLQPPTDSWLDPKEESGYTMSERGQRVFANALKAFGENEAAQNDSKLAGKLFFDHLRLMPMGDLPLGGDIADMLSEFPLLDRIGGNFSTMSFDEVSSAAGKQGSKAAKDAYDYAWENFGKDHKFVWYSLLAAGAVGAGYYTYENGTKTLEDLGVPLETKFHLFDKQLQVDLGTSFSPKLRDGSLNLGLRGAVGIGEAHVSGRGTWDRDGLSSYELRSGLKLDASRLGLDALDFETTYSDADRRILGFSSSVRKGIFSAAAGIEHVLDGETSYHTDLGLRLAKRGWEGYVSGYVNHTQDMQEDGDDTHYGIKLGITVRW